MDILENAIENVKDEINRRQDFVRTLNEYGIFLMQRGINNSILNEQAILQQQGNIPQTLELIHQNINQDFRKIKTMIFLDRYRDLGYGRCNVCLKDFNQYERVKRFPRECDHIFHIKCLEVWMKIEASCPTCMRNYLGYEYNNVDMNLITNCQHSRDRNPLIDDAYNRAEEFSIFNQWKKDEHIHDGFQYEDSKNKMNPYLSVNMQEYHKEFELKRKSDNPFVRMTYFRHQKYMEEQRRRK